MINTQLNRNIHEKNGKFIFDVTKNKHDSDEDIVISFTVYNVGMWID